MIAKSFKIIYFLSNRTLTDSIGYDYYIYTIWLPHHSHNLSLLTFGLLQKGHESGIKILVCLNSVEDEEKFLTFDWWFFDIIVNGLLTKK